MGTFKEVYERETGRECITTFWDDFTIAEIWGFAGIKNTFDRAFKEWKHDIKYLSELAIVLNWKSWKWAEKDEKIAQLYIDCGDIVADYVYSDDTPTTPEDRQYFFEVTD